MRIITGLYKGQRLFQPTDRFTRPLRDMVKESIFNLIEHSNKINLIIKNINVLDLFAGSGSFGLECLSRGAGSVTFVENYINAFNILKKNISKLNEKDKSNMLFSDCFDYLDNIKDLKNKFDLIFLDPPYKEEKINGIINKIREKKILNKNGIIILHRHSNDKIQIDIKTNIIDSRIYGTSKIFFVN